MTAHRPGETAPHPRQEHHLCGQVTRVGPRGTHVLNSFVSRAVQEHGRAARTPPFMPPAPFQTKIENSSEEHSAASSVGETWQVVGHGPAGGRRDLGGGGDPCDHSVRLSPSALTWPASHGFFRGDVEAEVVACSWMKTWYLPPLYDSLLTLSPGLQGASPKGNEHVAFAPPAALS